MACANGLDASTRERSVRDAQSTTNGHMLIPDWKARELRMRAEKASGTFVVLYDPQSECGTDSSCDQAGVPRGGSAQVEPSSIRTGGVEIEKHLDIHARR